MLEQGKSFYYKELVLVTPDHARNLGINSEAPILTGGGLTQPCQECGVIYKPLPYQANIRIHAHHLHQDNTVGGGIYFFITKPSFDHEGKFHFIDNLSGSWSAILEPSENMYRDDVWTGRAESVFVKKIITFCRSCRVEVGSSYFRKKVEPLSEGLLIEDNSNPGLLNAICSLSKHPDLTYNPKFIFQIDNNGQIEFVK